MSRITVCLDCPLYQTGGWCKHKRKDVGALQPACDHAKKMNETFNPEDKEEEPMTDMNTRTEARRAKKAAKAQTETVKEPKPIFNPIVAVKDIPDQTLADELRHRGWDVKATRPKTIIEEL